MKSWIRHCLWGVCLYLCPPKDSPTGMCVCVCVCVFIIFLISLRPIIWTPGAYKLSLLTVADPELGYGGVRFFWKIFLNEGPNHFFNPLFPKIYPFFKELTFFWISMGGPSTAGPPWIRRCLLILISIWIYNGWVHKFSTSFFAADENFPSLAVLFSPYVVHFLKVSTHLQTRQSADQIKPLFKMVRGLSG